MKYYNKRKLFITKTLDHLISIFIKKPKEKDEIKLDKEPQKILICEYFLLGDLIMAMTSIKAIREKYKDRKIDLLGSEYARDLLSQEAIFNEVATFKCPWAYNDYSLTNIISLIKILIRMRKANYDLAIDCRGDIRNNALLYLIGAKRRVSYDISGGGSFLTDIVAYDNKLDHQTEDNEHLVKSMGIVINDNIEIIKLTKQEECNAKNVIAGLGINANKMLIGIHPGAGKEKRLWPTYRYKKLIDLILKENDADIIILSGKTDEKVAKEIKNNFAQKVHYVSNMKIRALAAIMACCNIFIGLDSGPTHLALAMGIPTIALYGPNPPDFVGPYKPRAKCRSIFKDGLDCRPCLRNECINKINGISACMEAIYPEEIITNIKNII